MQLMFFREWKNIDFLSYSISSAGRAIRLHRIGRRSDPVIEYQTEREELHMTEKQILLTLVNKYVDLSELMFLMKREKDEHVRAMYNFNKYEGRVLTEDEYEAIRNYILTYSDDLKLNPTKISCNIKGKESK